MSHARIRMLAIGFTFVLSTAVAGGAALAQKGRHVHWPAKTSPVAEAAGTEQALKVGKKGEISFDHETQVGGVTLKPGNYIMQHRVEGEDHFIHFTEVTNGIPSSPGTAGVPKAHPGEVKCKLERLQAKSDRTAVYIDNADGVSKVTRVEIAGENVAHLFLSGPQTQD